MQHDVLHDLLELLTQERVMLLSGNYARLEDTAQRKEQLLQRLSSMQTDEKSLRNLKRTMVRNQRLVAAALGGIKEAEKRLQQLQMVQTGLTTYDQTGALNTRPTGGSSVERKA